MSSEFLPINMTRRVTAEDTSYLRQNQQGTQAKPVKAGVFSGFIPTNDEIKAKTDNALQMLRNNVYPERGSILNILV